MAPEEEEKLFGTRKKGFLGFERGGGGEQRAVDYVQRILIYIFSSGHTAVIITGNEDSSAPSLLALRETVPTAAPPPPPPAEG